MPPNAQEVLDFWFGAPGDPGHAQPRVQWFRKDPAFDTAIVQRFGTLIEQALAGGIDDWIAPPAAPLPSLARVIVLDQFTRNAFRGSARAFAGDALALQTACMLVASGLDRQLGSVQRQFAYLPFEHAEDLAHQRTSVQLFAQLGRDEPGLAGLVEWARRHHGIIERFGRFPHRNAALGRVSTAAEIEFLKQPGSSF
ncbi:MAG: DUF924 family protein [Burkholderiaceae bacterium]|nr:DUF924 family protein [Burkholderiaceae bacterium]